jgi:hypothetical protein
MNSLLADSISVHSLMPGHDGANRPLICFRGPADLSDVIPTKTAIAGRQLTLAGPSEKLDAAHWPVRGDLAHIRLADRCFVPHYAVPMPHIVQAPGAALRKLGQAQADVLQKLDAGAGFDVLDMSGGWCWGQAVNDGFVGYIRHDLLMPASAGNDPK